MIQIIQSYRSGEIWLADVPAPALRAGGAIVQTAHSLVSAGTERMILELAKKSLLGKARARPDLVKKVIAKMKTQGVGATLETVFAKLDAPIPTGYSCAGTIVEVGSGATSFRPGDRVACAGAGYATHAEFNYVPKNLLAKIPPNVSLEDASFTTIGTIAMQGVRQADVRLGELVVVIGLGLVGLLTVQILQAAGCRVLGSDPDPAKQEHGRAAGAECVHPSDLVAAADAFTAGHGADAVIITAATTSNEPIEQAAVITRVKGKVVVVGAVGMEVPRDPFYKKELDLRLSMSYGPGRYDATYEEGGRDYPIGYVRWTEHRNMLSFLHLLATGKVTPSRLVTHRFKIDEALKAYELLEKTDQSYLGILIDYPPRETPFSTERAIEIRPVAAESAIGIGLIGAGNFAKSVLIPTLSKLGQSEWVAVCTNNGATANQAAKKYQFAYATTDQQKLINDPKINLVVIATRHDTHALLTCAALNVGKHVFVEKPLCLTREELADVEQSAGRSSRFLMVGFNRRFSPHTAAIREAFASRRGPMLITYRINAGPLPADSWVVDPEIGGGRVVGEMCHFIDWCEAITQSTPISVQADCAASPEDSASMQENVVATIRYEDGSVAMLQYIASGPSELPKERIEVFAEGKAAVLDDFVTTTFPGSRRPALKTKQDKGFAGEWSAIFNAIRTGGAPPIPVESIFRTSRVTFAILDSLGHGRPVAVASIL